MPDVVLSPNGKYLLLTSWRLSRGLDATVNFRDRRDIPLVECAAQSLCFLTAFQGRGGLQRGIQLLSGFGALSLFG